MQKHRESPSFLIGAGETRFEFYMSDKIGHGSFGTIYLGKNIATGEQVAIKIESSHVKFPQLAYESKLYEMYQGRPGFPRCYYFGKEYSRNTMVMQLCGKSLEALFQQCGCKFSLKTVLKLACEMLMRLKTLHSKGFLHRDVKPDNFLVASSADPDQDRIFLIDFGLAKRFYDPKTRRHRPMKKGKQLTGTARYASVNTHCGLEQSRRDDLESLGYVLVYFLQGNLPWQGLVNGAFGVPKTKDEKYQLIFSTKVATDLDTLCAGLPTPFCDYLKYTRSLGYEEVPNYDSLIDRFMDLAKTRGMEWDSMYDWTGRIPVDVGHRGMSMHQPGDLVRTDSPSSPMSPGGLLGSMQASLSSTPRFSTVTATGQFMSPTRSPDIAASEEDEDEGAQNVKMMDVKHSEGKSNASGALAMDDTPSEPAQEAIVVDPRIVTPSSFVKRKNE